MKADPPRLLSYWVGSGAWAGITEYQQVTPGSWDLSSRKQVPSGVGRGPMFSLATVNWGFGRPARVTASTLSMAVLLNAISWAPLKKPPPRPGAFELSGNSS